VVVLSPNLDTLRLSLHVLAACVWVGGQITLAGLVPTLRRAAPDSVGPTARAFARLAWPAFLVLVVTGGWSLSAVDVGATSTAYQVTVLIKVLAAAAAGAATVVHSVGRSRAAVALGGAIGLVSSLLALFFGLLLRSGS
jgi:putative copper export protein